MKTVKVSRRAGTLFALCLFCYLCFGQTLQLNNNQVKIESSKLLVGNTTLDSTISVAGGMKCTGGFSSNGKISVLKGINTTAGDAATINAVVGRFRKDATGTTFILTNSYVDANSIVILTFASSHGVAITETIATAGAGTFTASLTPQPLVNTDINFLIIN